ncbi:MAG: Gx transporter family protein [Clostridia bacterium]|nr:Gx transporter family protein [Clostridia bacterium]
MISSSAKIPSPARRIAYCGVFAAAAMIVSYLESFIPVGQLIGVPGLKLGLANILVAVAYFSLGASYAASVSLVRIVISSLLFGSVTSFVFSLFGGILSFTVLFLLGGQYKKSIGLIGISVLSAAAHNTGQILAASLVMSEISVFIYLPVLLIFSVPCGGITGTVAEITLSLITGSRKNKGNG